MPEIVFQIYIIIVNLPRTSDLSKILDIAYILCYKISGIQNAYF